MTYYLADHLGSIVQETNDSGTETLAREYDAWGNQLQGAGSNGYGFTGREWDVEISLYYYRARYYSGILGAFLSEDPIRFLSGDKNFRAYGRSAPLSNTDPTGLTVYPNGFKVSPELIVVLNKMNKEMFPNQDIIVTGGDRYVDTKGNVRSSTNNSIISNSARRSSHISGTAVDFRVTNTADFIAEEAAKKYFDWTSSDYPSAPHVHGDLRNKMGARSCPK